MDILNCKEHKEHVIFNYIRSDFRINLKQKGELMLFLKEVNSRMDISVVIILHIFAADSDTQNRTPLLHEIFHKPGKKVNDLLLEEESVGSFPETETQSEE